ncbi:NucA/NucB deoxyribonuclease domain-containing protein [Streptomyces sp. NPDC087845]|uniref:NucA/NucB deoxyribonuclease domain-containing protein n=2 Tax=unclassified Streptomyces TaxID=2593676 RepID=UPI0037FF3884
MARHPSCCRNCVRALSLPVSTDEHGNPVVWSWRYRRLRDRDVLRFAPTKAYTASRTTYDLSIDGLHTYYVLAGETPVLVHNCGTGYNSAGKPCGCGAPRIFTVDSAGEATAMPVHTIDRARFPDVASNFDDAIANGNSPIVNRLTGRANIRSNRNAAQAGLPRPDSLGTDVNGGLLSWEEYPFASTAQGGAGATTRLINRTQNTTHGRDSLWPFLRDNGVNNGDPYYVR